MSFVQVPPDSTGKLIDCVDVGGQQRQVVVIGDDGTGSDIMTQLNQLNEQIKALNDTMLYFITATLEKMPILDSNDRAQTRLGAIDTNLTLTTLGNLNNFSGGNTALIPYNLGAGAFHIYNNITVT